VVEKGFLLAIASGRMTPRIDPLIHRLGLDPIVISYNGGKVVAPRREDRKTLFHRPVPVEIAERFIRFSREENLLLNFYYEDRLFAEDGVQRRPFIDLYAERTGAEYVIEEDLSRFIGTPPTKMILLAEPARADELLEMFKAEIGERAFVTKSQPEYVEIMAPGVDKGAGLGVMAAHYGLTTEEIVAVGDATNDLELVRGAGLGVAVANATDDLKAAADVVTERTNNEGAVAEVVERWFLGKG
jgi:Cof subfamily protein (haloacid dehalogenase superfamily)